MRIGDPDPYWDFGPDPDLTDSIYGCTVQCPKGCGMAFSWQSSKPAGFFNEFLFEHEVFIFSCQTSLKTFFTERGGRNFDSLALSLSRNGWNTKIHLETICTKKFSHMSPSLVWLLQSKFKNLNFQI